jgi:hypothetical protein
MEHCILGSRNARSSKFRCTAYQFVNGFCQTTTGERTGALRRTAIWRITVIRLRLEPAAAAQRGPYRVPHRPPARTGGPSSSSASMSATQPLPCVSSSSSTVASAAGIAGHRQCRRTPPVLVSRQIVSVWRSRTVDQSPLTPTPPGFSSSPGARPCWHVQYAAKQGRALPPRPRPRPRPRLGHE